MFNNFFLFYIFIFHIYITNIYLIVIACIVLKYEGHWFGFMIIFSITLFSRRLDDFFHYLMEAGQLVKYIWDFFFLALNIFHEASVSIKALSNVVILVFDTFLLIMSVAGVLYHPSLHKYVECDCLQWLDRTFRRKLSQIIVSSRVW